MRRLVTCALTLACALPVAGNVEAATTENAHARSAASIRDAAGQDPIVPLPFAPFSVSSTTIGSRSVVANNERGTVHISAPSVEVRSPQAVSSVNVATATVAATTATTTAVTTPPAVTFDVTKVAGTPASPFSDLLMWGVPAEQPAPVTVRRVHAAPTAQLANAGGSAQHSATQGLAGLTESILSKTRLIASRITANAMHYIGTPYVFGGTTASGFDCSGYVQRIFAMVGVFLPRTADAQYAAGHHVDLAHARRGDLVFFTTYAAGASHVGIYLGNNEFIHSSSSRGVTVSNLNESYWAARFLGAERVLSTDKVAAATVGGDAVAMHVNVALRN